MIFDLKELHSIFEEGAFTHRKLNYNAIIHFFKISIQFKFKLKI